MNRRKHSPDRRTVMLGAAAAACSPAASEPAPPFPMRRGVNLGNGLEAPVEGEWGYRIEAAHLAAIKTAGFDGVRIPVRWDAHMDEAGRVDPVFLARVHEVCSWAADAGLMTQLNVHHFDALIEGGGTDQVTRFLGLWRSIAERFADASNNLIFEVLNEPHGTAWHASALTNLQAQAIGLVRESNPTRLVVVGPGDWQNISGLQNWRPPEGDNIAVSVHYYDPHAFTHDGAEWLGDDAPAFGRDWGTGSDRARVHEHFESAANWASMRGYAMQLGEFGVNRAVPIQQRATWTRAVREACEAKGFGWCVWDFAGAFPVWDAEAGAFIPLMRDALFS